MSTRLEQDRITQMVHEALPTWHVDAICPNGDRTRFDSATEAQDWCEWGHCCVAASEHEIEFVQDAYRGAIFVNGEQVR